MSKIRLYGSSSGYIDIAPAAAASNNTLTAPSTVGEIIAKDAAGAIGVTSMKASNVNVGAAVTISESGIEASGIGITCANINGGAIGGRRNIIINGAMEVAQRGTSSTDQLYSTVDRIRTSRTGNDNAPTYEQVDVASGTTPYTLGFRKAFKITNGNQTAGAGAADVTQFGTRIEGQDMNNSGWNYTSSSSYITLQFWVKASVAQNYYFRVFTKDGTEQNFPMETGALTANTWTKITKTISGNSNLQIDNDNGRGFDIAWTLYRGTNFTDSGCSLNTWAATGSSTSLYPDLPTTWYTTNDATFELTGVQLEVGSQATPFEHRNFGDELAQCQRYYDTSYAYGTAPGTGSMQAGAIYSRFGGSEITNRMDLGTRWTTTMRAAPTVVAYSPSAGTADRVDDNGTGAGSGTDAVRTVSSYEQVSPKGFGGIVLTAASDNTCSYHYTAEAEI